METEASARPLASASFIQVSDDMTVMLDGSTAGPIPVPHDPVALAPRLGVGRCVLAIHGAPDVQALMVEAKTDWPILLVSRGVLTRLGGARLGQMGLASFHLSTELRAIVLAVRHPPAPTETQTAYRGAKSIEFLCETIRQLRASQLAPVVESSRLSLGDACRVMAARRMIEEHLSEKLTLDLIARSCGLNRSKLTSGFKEIFDCTVAQAISEQRLARARRMLLTTDLPVSSIAYRTGYLNNASFARAFGRRFGRSPTDCRLRDCAA